MPVLDTTFLIDTQHQRKAAQAVEKVLLASEEPLIVPIQAGIEFATGVKNPSRALRELEQAFHVVACDLDVGREAARIARSTSKRGKRPRWADIQIAATASLLGMYIVTRNARDFGAMGVRFWDYARDPAPPE